MIKNSIPSLITCLNLVCGVIAILVDDVRLGVILILIGGICDVFDGLVARLLNATSKMGAELDSLADVVSFGVAPAILYYKAFGGDGSLLALLAPALIVSGGALRLARFNVTESKTTYFEGLAIPASGLLLCGIVIAEVYDQPLTSLISKNQVLIAAIASLAALLNISKIRMFSFKQFGKSKLVRVYFLILAVVAIASIIFFPWSALALTIVAYILIATLDHYLFGSERKMIEKSPKHSTNP